jgi:hypothetical protein
MVASRNIYVLVCVSLDLLWYCVLMACGFLADSLCLRLVVGCSTICVLCNQ